MKAKIPVRRGGVYFGDRNRNHLQALAWWVADLTLRGKLIDSNNFNSAVISDSMEYL